MFVLNSRGDNLGEIMWASHICYRKYYDRFAVPAILNEAVPATTQSVDTEIQGTLKCAYEYTGEQSYQNL